jgi:hypothetical protein
MGSVTWAVVGFLGAALLFVLHSLFVPLLQKDLEEGVPWFAAWLVRRAAQKLPATHRERFEQEWLAELSAIPGVMVFKLRFALSVSVRARSMRRAIQSIPPWWERLFRRLAHATAEIWDSYIAGPRHSRERAHKQSLRPRFPRPLYVLREIARQTRVMIVEAVLTSIDVVRHVFLGIGEQLALLIRRDQPRQVILYRRLDSEIELPIYDKDELEQAIPPDQIAPGMDEATFERLRQWGNRQPTGGLD